ncbi:hypothetical protein TNCV_5117851 [Trichonephila clavipes]|nr:hypothetical protein TNCV_5117851 [Trichonephila clavipes]
MFWRRPRPTPGSVANDDDDIFIQHNEITSKAGGTATAGSDVVQSGRPIFDDFFQHLWPYIGNNTPNVVFQMVKRLWLILETNSQVQNVKLGGHQTCLQ